MSLAESYDPLAKDWKERPWEYFAELRTKCPVHHHAVPQVEVE